MQIANHYLCCSGLPQFSLMASLTSADWQFLTHFFLNPYNEWDFLVLLLFLLHFLTSSFFFFPPWKIYLLKKSSVIDLECGFCLGLTTKLFDVFPRLTSHQIPGLGFFLPSTRRLVRWICLVSLIWMVGGAFSFLMSWWAIKLLESMCSCWCLYQRVTVYSQERAESC